MSNNNKKMKNKKYKGSQGPINSRSGDLETQILLVDTSGLNYTLGIRLPTKDYHPRKKMQKKCKESV